MQKDKQNAFGSTNRSQRAHAVNQNKTKLKKPNCVEQNSNSTVFRLQIFNSTCIQQILVV